MRDPSAGKTAKKTSVTTALTVSKLPPTAEEQDTPTKKNANQKTKKPAARKMDYYSTLNARKATKISDVAFALLNAKRVKKTLEFHAIKTHMVEAQVFP